MEGKQVGIFERCLNIVREYGVWNIVKTLAIVLLCGMVWYTVTNMDKVVEKVVYEHTYSKSREHTKAIERRRAVSPKVDSILNNALITLKCDRAFIVEMHNGTNNTAGLPFIYGEMTYEVVNDSIEHVDEDYTSLNLSRFTFPMFLGKSNVWLGTMDDLSEVDKKLADRLRSESVSYLVVTSLNGMNNVLGCFGVVYCNGHQPADRDKLLKIMAPSSQNLSVLLDYPNILEEDDKK